MSNQPPVMRRRYSPAVYRRRRLAVFLLFLVVVILVVVLLVRCGSTPAPTPTPTKTGTTAPTRIPLISPTPTGTSTTGAASATAAQYTGNAKECTPSSLVVGAFTDKTDYNAGELPQLSMTVTNKGSTDCKVNVGTSQQLFQVTSGNDVWWQSTDCQTEDTDFWILLPAGKTEKTGSPVSWVRERSSPDTCSSAREAAVGDGASYFLTTSLGGVQSKESKQFLLY